MCHTMRPPVRALTQEYKEAARQKSQETGITLIPNESNIFSWRALLKVRGGSLTAASGSGLCKLLR